MSQASVAAVPRPRRSHQYRPCHRCHGREAQQLHHHRRRHHRRSHRSTRLSPHHSHPRHPQPPPEAPARRLTRPCRARRFPHERAPGVQHPVQGTWRFPWRLTPRAPQVPVWCRRWRHPVTLGLRAAATRRMVMLLLQAPMLPTLWTRLWWSWWRWCERARVATRRPGGCAARRAEQGCSPRAAALLHRARVRKLARQQCLGGGAAANAGSCRHRLRR